MCALAAWLGLAGELVYVAIYLVGLVVNSREGRLIAFAALFVAEFCRK